MCGIIGIIARNTVATGLLEGLRRLEYRGYDSAGIATLVDGRIECRRAEGKLANLARRIDHQPVQGAIGIGHTRWATHGLPTETNAHPIATDRVAVVHNGIIENFQALRHELERLGYVFRTDTDTEAVAILTTHFLEQGLSPREAVAKTLERLDGAFALAFLFAGEHDLLIGARRGSPLAIGYGDGEMFLGSDALALAPLTRRITYLEEGDWAVVTSRAVTIFDAANNEVQRPIRESAASGALIGKGYYRHFMLKEIFEQPAVIGDTLNAMINPATRTVHLPELPFELGELERVTMIACGTAYHACIVAKYWLERIARISVEIDIASEFRYRAPARPSSCRNRARPPTLWRRCATRRRRRSGSLPSSTSRRARSPARPKSYCRPWPAPRSASPRPRPLRRSSPSSPRSPSRWRGRGAPSATSVRRSWSAS
jgi:glucosamine--fructose-6-phosphate aminotransferase (isomerizing)